MNRTRTLFAAASVGAILLVPVACSDDDEDTSTTDTSEVVDGAEAATVGDVTITDTWARPTTPGTTTSAVYMHLVSEDGDALVGVSVPSSVAAEAQIHETSMAGDMDDMDMDDMDMDDMDTDDMDTDDMDTTESTMEGMSGFAPQQSDDMTDDTMADMETTDMSMDDDHMGGEMQMQQVDQIDLPAGETVTLEPGGYHIMLLEVAEPLEDGQEIDVTLEFEKAGSTTLTVVVGAP